MNKKNIVWGLIFIMAAILVVCGAFGILGNPVNLFLSIGLSFLFPKYKHFYKHSSEESFHEIVNEADDSVINLSAKFGGSVKYVNTNQLQEVNIDCAFSGMKVYFDHADIAGEKASVNVRLSFSGLELYVPKNWNVVDNLGCTLGGVERRGTASETTDKTLVLNGSVSFSGVKIM